MIKRTKSLLFGLLLAFVASAREDYTRTFDKTLPLRGGQKLSVEHKLGDVVIRAHAQSDIIIHAEVHVSASGADEARQFADRIEILVNPSSSEISIRTRYPDRPTAFLGLRNLSYYVRYEITIPETTPLEVRNSFGSVSVSGLKAGSNIITSHGAIDFHDGRGTQRFENSFGEVRVANNSGDLTIENNNGAVDVSDVTGALNLRDRFGKVSVSRVTRGVRLVNSNGEVQVQDSGGQGSIENAFGPVEVRNFRGELTVNNRNGAVEARGVGGAASINTSFGAVQCSDVSGRLSIRSTNAEIHAERVGGPLSIQNAFGAVIASDVQGSLQINSGNSNISVEKVHGSATVKTSFGLVEANEIVGALIVENANGGVRATNTRGAQVLTSFGPVSLVGVSGPIQVENQNGNVDASIASQAVCQTVKIKTSFSELKVRLPSDASYHVAARTSFGNITTEFPMSVSGNISSDLDGVIGGGRCEMKLTNSNGAIQILKGGR